MLSLFVAAEAMSKCPLMGGVWEVSSDLTCLGCSQCFDGLLSPTFSARYDSSKEVNTPGATAYSVSCSITPYEYMYLCSPLNGMIVNRRVTPALNLPVHIYLHLGGDCSKLILGDPGAVSGGGKKSKRARKKSQERREEPLGTSS